MLTSSSAFDFLSSKNWRLYCPLSMLRWRPFYHLAQLFCRMGLTITMLLSGKYYRWPRELGRTRPVWLFHLFFDRFLLALQKGWCITQLFKNSDRYRDDVSQAGDSYTDRSVLGYGLYFPPPFCSLVWSVEFTLPLQAAPLASGLARNGGLLDSKPVQSWLGKVLRKCAYCFIFSHVWSLSWWYRLWGTLCSLWCCSK